MELVIKDLLTLPVIESKKWGLDTLVETFHDLGLAPNIEYFEESEIYGSDEKVKIDVICHMSNTHDDKHAETLLKVSFLNTPVLLIFVNGTWNDEFNPVILSKSKLSDLVLYIHDRYFKKSIEEVSELNPVSDIVSKNMLFTLSKINK